MAKNYKLSQEIKGFIIAQKKTDQKLSCRALTGLIKEHFQVNISKSLINNVIKESNLSSPVGRRGERQLIAVKPPYELKISRKDVEFMENGGFFFLKAADIKLGLTYHLSEILSGYYPDIPKHLHQRIIQTLMYSPFFKNKMSLWLFIGSEVPDESMARYSQQFIKAPFDSLKGSLESLGITHNISDINNLCKEALFRLNSYILHFFPPEYQFLDFLSMQKRFYSLPARLEKKGNLLVIQLFYPPDFLWMNDIIWQEGFLAAANKLNEAKIITPENEQIWIIPQVELSEGNAF